MKSVWKSCRYSAGGIPGRALRSAKQVPCITAGCKSNLCASFLRWPATVKFTATYLGYLGKRDFSIRHNCLLSETPLRLFTLVFVTWTAALDWNYFTKCIHWFVCNEFQVFALPWMMVHPRPIMIVGFTRHPRYVWGFHFHSYSAPPWPEAAARRQWRSPIFYDSMYEYCKVTPVVAWIPVWKLVPAIRFFAMIG